ncbi:MAG: type VI secretion system baseplate subunit TssE [Planctomycetota bacterium]|jgi:type VI secretion system lysozyme-like protein|nr:type VI secretion system baseplate subunit TssE [Planctomycetota bacterium]
MSASVRARLLERFDPTVERGGRRAVLASLVASLHELLNAVPGTALAVPDFGMPPRNELIRMCPDELARVRSLIEAAISRFEPRLQRVAVDIVERVDADDYRQLFLVRAQLAQPDAEPVRLLLRINSDGRFQVKVQE